jgi:hypothetical protein
MTAFRKSINALKFEGVPYRTFINDNADMVIRYNEYGENYTDEVYDSTGTLMQIIDVQDGYKHIQEVLK